MPIIMNKNPGRRSVLLPVAMCLLFALVSAGCGQSGAMQNASEEAETAATQQMYAEHDKTDENEQGEEATFATEWEIVMDEGTIPPPPPPKETLEDFLNGIDVEATRDFYERLYALYDFETFNQRSEIPQYFQTVYYDKFSVGTIQSAGCGITSLAMVSSYLFEEEITPDMMLKYDRGDNPASALEAGIADMKLNCTKYFGMKAIENLDKALDEGHPIIANMRKDSIFTDSGHFIVIAGKTEDGKYIVNDPNLENYYLPRRVDGFTNGFPREQMVMGLSAIYIFDTKEEFVDMRSEEVHDT